MEPLRFRFMLNYVEHDFLALPDQLRATLVIVSEDSPLVQSSLKIVIRGDQAQLKSMSLSAIEEAAISQVSRYLVNPRVEALDIDLSKN